MSTYKHRFPPDVISYAAWLYYRFNLSHRDIEDLLAERGITVSREVRFMTYLSMPTIGQGNLVRQPGCESEGCGRSSR
jgi:hypothetical protein